MKDGLRFGYGCCKRFRAAPGAGTFVLKRAHKSGRVWVGAVGTTPLLLTLYDGIIRISNYIISKQECPNLQVGALLLVSSAGEPTSLSPYPSVPLTDFIKP